MFIGRNADTNSHRYRTMGLRFTNFTPCRNKVVHIDAMDVPVIFLQILCAKYELVVHFAILLILQMTRGYTMRR